MLVLRYMKAHDGRPCIQVHTSGILISELMAVAVGCEHGAEYASRSTRAGRQTNPFQDLRCFLSSKFAYLEFLSVSSSAEISG